MPQDSLRLEVDSTGSLIAGQEFVLEAMATETRQGFSNRAHLIWQGSDSGPVLEGNGITLTNSSDAGESLLKLQFNPLRTSHAQVYTGIATLESLALHGPLVKSEDYTVTVQSECTALRYKLAS